MEDQDAPIPGKRIDSGKAERWIKRFTEVFRPKGRDPLNPKLPIASNIPTACLIKGQPIQKDFSNLPLAKELSVMVFFERDREVYETTLAEILAYFNARQPWQEEDDICLFDSSLQWCLGLSHEEKLNIGTT